MKDNFGKCRVCGQRILWIRTRAGKNMPVNPVLVDFRRTPGGKERIVTEDGDVIAGELCRADDDPDGYGYISHFATCVGYRKENR